MKKTVKGLIIAASVAAVVGVGAVSFAKWEVTSDNDVALTGSTGVINTLGDLTVTPADDTYTTGDGNAIVMNALYPVDQGGTYLTYWTFTLTSEVTGTQTVSYKLAGSLGKGSDDQSTEVAAAALYWTTTAPTESTTAGDGTAVAAALTDTGAALTGVSNGDTVYVYMIASGTDAMKADISLTFEQA